MRKLALLLVCCAPTLGAQAVPTRTGSVDLTIGAGDQAVGPYLFEDVRGLAMDAQGRIVVADAKTNQLRVYAADGKHLYSAGRRGEGPGDLSEPCCVTFGADGALWVTEHGNRRFSIFTLGADRATFVRSVSMATTNNFMQSFDRVSWDAAGRVMDVSGGHLDKHPRSSMVRSFHGASGAVTAVDTIMPPPKDSLAYFTVERKLDGGGIATATYYQNFGATELRTMGLRGEYAAAVNTRYAVTWFDAAHRRIALVQRPGEGPALSAREKESAEKRDARIETATGIKLPFVVPARKPAINSIGFDLEGRLWVERSVADGARREADVYTPDGKQAAVMTWPANVRLLSWAIRGSMGLGLETDPDGVQRVVRLRFR